MLIIYRQFSGDIRVSDLFAQADKTSKAGQACWKGRQILAGNENAEDGTYNDNEHAQ